MYTALGKNTKVILTVRDNDEVWYNSWLNFFWKNFDRRGINMATWLSWYGAFGREIKDMTRIGA